MIRIKALAAHPRQVAGGWGSYEYQSMVSTTPKIRYVIGLFSSPRDLECALAALCEADVPSPQIHVIVPGDENGQTAPWKLNGVSGTFDTWIATESGGAPSWQLVAVDAQRAATQSEDGPMADFHSWGLDRYARQLDRHLRTGGGILIVQSKTDAEERMACTTLLRHADAGVQMHEISRSSPVSRQ
jgi:hypothetical protein